MEPYLGGGVDEDVVGAAVAGQRRDGLTIHAPEGVQHHRHLPKKTLGIMIIRITIMIEQPQTTPHPFTSAMLYMDGDHPTPRITHHEQHDGRDLASPGGHQAHHVQAARQDVVRADGRRLPRIQLLGAPAHHPRSEPRPPSKPQYPLTDHRLPGFSNKVSPVIYSFSCAPMTPTVP
jgi:hypothetical protein